MNPNHTTIETLMAELDGGTLGPRIAAALAEAAVGTAACNDKRKRGKVTIEFATNPGHGDHVATLQLAATPAYLAILSTRGVAFTQRDALDFIEDWAHVITATREDDAGNQQAIPLAHAIAAIRKVKIEAKSSAETTEGNFQQSRSVLESVAASSDAGLPDALEFHITPYQGLSQRFFRLRLSISTSHREPTLRFRIIGLEKAQEEILEEFKDLLTGKIGDAATMTIGTFTL